MTDALARRIVIEAASKSVENTLTDAVLTRRRLTVVKAPPGSGKTHVLTHVAKSVAAHPGLLRVAIACQTNTQADDTCKRLAQIAGAITVVRVASSTGVRAHDLPQSVHWTQKMGDVPHGPCIAVATSAKWGLAGVDDPFDVLFVDEAWQLAFKDFQLLTQVAPCFVLIGDPGQIPPVVSVSTQRWETSLQAPQRPAPEVLLDLAREETLCLQLPATRRLPHDSARLVRAFYEFDFDSTAGPGDRSLVVESSGASGSARALAHLRLHSMAALTIPTPSAGPPLEVDPDIVAGCVDLVTTALSGRSQWFQADHSDAAARANPLKPINIGISATHRRMVTAIGLALPAPLRGHVRVDTPERWQGLECALMLVVHPLSSVRRPSEFDLETGRLCVMASRHRAGLVVITRDHLAETLAHTIPSARQPIGAPDVAGRGHAQHVRFWEQLSTSGAVFTS